MSSPSSNTDPLETSSFRCLLVSESYIIVVIGNVVVAYHKESKQQCHQLIAAPLHFMSVTLCDENSILVLNRTDFKLSSTITKYSIVTTGQGPRIYKQQYFGIERHLTGWASNAKDMCTYDQNTYLVNVHSSLRIMSEEGKALFENVSVIYSIVFFYVFQTVSQNTKYFVYFFLTSNKRVGDYKALVTKP